MTERATSESISLTPVFICWSSTRSRLAAEALRPWLAAALQRTAPFMSDIDIQAGADWWSEIADQLKTAKVGVVCLTDENQRSPWVLFESGALSKGIGDNRVITYCMGVEPGTLAGPLSRFQAVRADREGTWKLVRSINDNTPAPLAEDALKQVFESHFSTLDTNLERARNYSQCEAAPTERELLVEILRVAKGVERQAYEAHERAEEAQRYERLERLRRLEALVSPLRGDKLIKLIPDDEEEHPPPPATAD